MNTKTSHPTRLAFGLILAGTAMLLTSCTSAPITVGPVGPHSGRADLGLGGTGRLIVHTATEEKRAGKDFVYYVHTEYVVRTQDDRMFKWVPNHAGNTDQSTQIVSLPTGIYEVVASSEGYGRIHVPVVIRAGQTTEVDLEGRWTERGNPTTDGDMVRLPNGQIIGWSASLAKAGPKN